MVQITMCRSPCQAPQISTVIVGAGTEALTPLQKGVQILERPDNVALNAQGSDLLLSSGFGVLGIDKRDIWRGLKRVERRQCHKAGDTL